MPLDRSNLCVRGFEALRPADGLAFRIRSEIPPSAGLGSSAAAIVAGLVAADHMYELDAPALRAGAASWRATRTTWRRRCSAASWCAPTASRPASTRRPASRGSLAIPPDPVPTAQARAALPAEVPISDAVHNVAHASLLMLGLARDDFSLIGRGLADRLHQDRRAHLYPRSMELVGRADELGAVGATISGAGPAVLFWCHWEQTGNVLGALREARRRIARSGA